METNAGMPGALAENRAPRHVWIVGTLAALWSGWGCWHFAHVSLRHTATMARIAPDVVDTIDAYPAWVLVAAAMEVGFALLGALLLLLARSRWASPAYAASLFGLGANQFYQLATGLPLSWSTWSYWAANLGGWFIAAALLVYALRLRRSGILA